jgi:hypothetical protein
MQFYSLGGGGGGGLEPERRKTRELEWIGFCQSGTPDPYLWLMDPDPIPDPTPFFINVKDAKKFFFIFFYNLPSAHRHIIFMSKKLNFLLQFCIKILFCSQLNTFMRKRDSYLWLVDPDPEPGGPKTCGSRSGSGSQKLVPRISRGRACTSCWLNISSKEARVLESWYLRLVGIKMVFLKEIGIFFIPNFYVLLIR